MVRISIQGRCTLVLIAAVCFVSRDADALLYSTGLPSTAVRTRRGLLLCAAGGPSEAAEGSLSFKKDEYDIRRRQISYMVHQLSRIGSGACLPKVNVTYTIKCLQLCTIHPNAKRK